MFVCKHMSICIYHNIFKNIYTHVSSSIRNIAHTEKLEPPKITSTSKHHAKVNDTFQLICESRTAHDVKVKFDWSIPDGVDKVNRLKSTTEQSQFKAPLLHNKKIYIYFGSQIT